MALTFHVDIVSAEESLLSATAERLVAPGEMGELGILAHHAPLLARLKPGIVRVIRGDGGEESFMISGGFLEVQPHIVTVLVDTAFRTEGLDMAAAMAAKERAEEAMREKMMGVEYEKLKLELDQVIELFRSIEEFRKKKKR